MSLDRGGRRSTPYFPNNSLQKKKKNSWNECRYILNICCVSICSWCHQLFRRGTACCSAGELPPHGNNQSHGKVGQRHPPCSAPWPGRDRKRVHKFNFDGNYYFSLWTHKCQTDWIFFGQINEKLLGHQNRRNVLHQQKFSIPLKRLCTNRFGSMSTSFHFPVLLVN